MNIQNRARKLNKILKKEGPVIYVMSRDQRIEDNHALLYAQELGEVVVLFNLYTKVRNRILQQYEFMLDGLKDVAQDLEKLDIPFILATDDALKNLKEIENLLDPKAFVFDFSPLRGPQNLRVAFAQVSKSEVYEVDTHNIVPIWKASDKEEFGAYTLRPKIYKQLQTWLVEPGKVNRQKEMNLAVLSNQKGFYINPAESDWKEILSLVKAEKIDSYKPDFVSGSNAAKSTLMEFLENKIELFAEKRNDPSENYQSNLSPYLHYGQISSLRAVLEAQKLMRDKLGKDLDLNLYKNKAGHAHVATLEDSIHAFIEEIVVRKELADNFCYYNQNYDKVEGAKDWALKSHAKHFNDPREFLYTFEELEFARTHDPAWNAAQKQLITKGKIHGYMRMYWAKKILEWTVNPRQALSWAVKLNDKYHIDGYDPNGYTGIQWSISGVHDRPWFERPIFGQIRYMNYEGLKKRFDIEKYIEMYS